MTSPAPRPGRLRIGIAGAGLMGRWHAHAARRAGATLVGVADPDRAAADRLPPSIGPADLFSDLESLIRARRPDVVHICTPLDTHDALVRLALDAGLHVVVEKPLTPRADRTKALLDLAQARGLLLCPVHQFLFQKGMTALRTHRARLGRLVHLQATFFSAGGAGRDPSSLDAIAADILPHPLSLFRAVLDHEPGPVDWSARHPRPGELHAVGAARDVSLSIRISMTGRPTACALEIVGEERSYHLNLYHGYGFIEPGAVSRARKVLHPFDRAGRTLAAAATNLAYRSLRREPAYPGLRDLISACYAFVRGEAPAPIPPDAVLNVALERDRLMRTAGPPLSD